MVGYPVTLYGVYVRTLGIRDLHHTTTTRALLATLVPLLISLAFLLLTLLLPQPGAPPGS